MHSAQHRSTVGLLYCGVGLLLKARLPNLDNEAPGYLSLVVELVSKQVSKS